MLANKLLKSLKCLQTSETTFNTSKFSHTQIEMSGLQRTSKSNTGTDLLAAQVCGKIFKIHTFSRL